ncbi:hypothetical protein HRbin39_01711 [bacterium HR39]|nr:hypothetical protein HRbin39_01711 [bacterium HR39]
MLLDRHRSLLFVVDVQQRLLPAMGGGEGCVARIGLLLEGARILDVPVMASEQYPKGLGPTVPPLRERLGNAPVFEKITFSCARDETIRTAVLGTGRRQLVLCGIEAHVCVLQTALDFAAEGLDVSVVADAVDSRRASSRELALARLRQAGVRVVDSEMVLFEWLERAGTDEFRAVSKLVR